MPDLLTPTERAALREARTPDARCALLLEWVLGELRGAYEQQPPAEPVDWTCVLCGGKGEHRDKCPKRGGVNFAFPLPFTPTPAVPVEQADQLLPPAKRKRGRPRKTELGR